MTWWDRLRESALDLVYPPKCALCGRLGPLNPCERCRAGLEPVEVRPIPRLPAGCRAAWACHAYEGNARELVRALKYQHRTSLAGFLSAQMAEGLGQIAFPVDWTGGEPIVPVPIHPVRRRERGFNQAEILCERLDAARVRPELLLRVRHTPAQASLNREARLVNLQGAFRAPWEVAGRRILLIDDVSTTGGTVEECAATLRRAGALDVCAFVYAATL